jgi:hypothetical protein
MSNLVTVKLANFQSQEKLLDFAEHLELLNGLTYTTSFCYIYKPEDKSFILQYDINEELHGMSLQTWIYYYSDLDYFNNKPIIKVGVDCNHYTSDKYITKKDLEDLKLKSYV